MGKAITRGHVQLEEVPVVLSSLPEEEACYQAEHKAAEVGLPGHRWYKGQDEESTDNGHPEWHRNYEVKQNLLIRTENCQGSSDSKHGP